jgi:hypothetical protein
VAGESRVLDVCWLSRADRNDLLGPDIVVEAMVSPCCGLNYLVSELMVILCADCGCLVDRGVRITVCADPMCCCRDLPIREDGVEAVP